MTIIKYRLIELSDFSAVARAVCHTLNRIWQEIKHMLTFKFEVLERVRERSRSLAPTNYLSQSIFTVSTVMTMMILTLCHVRLWIWLFLCFDYEFDFHRMFAVRYPTFTTCKSLSLETTLAYTCYNKIRMENVSIVKMRNEYTNFVIIQCVNPHKCMGIVWNDWV